MHKLVLTSYFRHHYHALLILATRLTLRLCDDVAEWRALCYMYVTWGSSYMVSTKSGVASGALVLWVCCSANLNSAYFSKSAGVRFVWKLCLHLMYKYCHFYA